MAQAIAMNMPARRARWRNPYVKKASIHRSVAMGDQVMTICQHLSKFFGSAKFLMITVVDQSLIETGYLINMSVHDANFMSNQDNGDSLTFVKMMQHIIEMPLSTDIHSSCRLIKK